MNLYAGIGSRETPPDILEEFENIAEFLARNDFVLRSGHAPGADQAFERGCDRVKGKKEIFLPWYKFEGSDSKLCNVSQEAFDLASKFHPRWSIIESNGAKKLLARDGYQVVGEDLKTYSDFIVCYTKNGSGYGGTGQALRIAKSFNIPIFDFGDVRVKEKFYQFCKDNCIKI